MKKLQSGLDAWRYLITANTKRRSVEGFLPLILSGAGALGVFPFMVLRYMQGAWIAAIVDTVLVIGFVSLGTYVYRTRRVGFASAAIAFFCVAGVISTVYFIGPNQTYWAYPALMAVFYLLRPVIAVALAAITLIAIVPKLLSELDTHSAITIVITIAVMSAIAFGFSLITNRQREKLMQLATKDPLTGAGNRRALDAKMLDLVNTHKRNGSSAALLMLDLDHFKKVNDIHGHAVGDQILQRVTEIVNLRIRVTDSLYRIGGEEFVVVLDEQNLERAGHLAEQLRTIIEANELVPDQAVTISLGVAELRNDETAKAWLQRSDEALYQAKRSGRNSTVLAE